MKQNQLTVVLIIIGITLFLAILVYVAIIIRKRKKKKDSNKIDENFINILIESVGGITNIKSLSLEHQRLGFILTDIKKIDSNKLKNELDFSAILKGKELKILVKENAKDIHDYINELIKGEN